MTRIVGIDPGISGALVCMKDGRPEHLRRLPFEGNRLDVRELLRWLNALRPEMVCLEEYMAVSMQSLSSTVTGARNHGKVEAVCLALALPVVQVSPFDWHKALGFPKDDRPAKAKALELAVALYPAVNLVPDGCRVPHDGIVDALLIAHYACKVAARNIDAMRGNGKTA